MIKLNSNLLMVKVIKFKIKFFLNFLSKYIIINIYQNKRYYG